MHQTRKTVGAVDEVDYIDAMSVGPHDATSVPKGALVTVRGWAALLENPSSALGACVLVDGGSPVEATYGLDRPDVARAMDDERYATTGLRGIVSTAHLDPGVHALSLAIRDRDGNLVAIDASREFVVDDSLAHHAMHGVPSDLSTPIAVDSLTIDGLAALEPLEATPGSVVGVSGWAIDLPQDDLGRAVFGTIDGKVVKGVYGLTRLDVARDLHSERYRASGFALHMPLESVAPGEHLLRVHLVGADGATVYAGPQIRIDVAPHGVISNPLLASGNAGAGRIDSAVVFDAAGNLRTSATPLQIVRGDQILVRGWAYDGAENVLARGVHVCIDDLPSTTAIYGLGREDVALSIGQPELAACGFSALLSTATLAVGAHAITLRIIGRDGRTFGETPERLPFLVAEAF